MNHKKELLRSLWVVCFVSESAVLVSESWMASEPLIRSFWLSMFPRTVAECRIYLAAWFPECRLRKYLGKSSSRARLPVVKKTAYTVMTKGS